MDENTERCLIRRAQDGDEYAFCLLFEENKVRLYNWIKRKLGHSSDEDAEELAQETFLRAWRYLKKFRGECRFYTWLVAIARNLCHDFLERERKRLELFIPVELTAEEQQDFLNRRFGETPNSNPLDILIDNELASLIRQALESLPSKYKEVAYLKWVEGMTESEIAKTLSIPVGTVCSQINTAKEHLRRRLKHLARHNNLTK
jgi:RNA polymerase sigma-70 factor, ECF subfamily